jgi:hypothetical protein
VGLMYSMSTLFSSVLGEFLAFVVKGKYATG